MQKMLQISAADTVAVALSSVAAGKSVLGVTAKHDIAQGHKMALRAMEAGEHVVKYGFPIGTAKCAIAPGEWVHVHNVKTGLAETVEYHYAPTAQPLAAVPPETFQGFLRADGRAGIRNEIWVIPTVGCVNGVCGQLVRQNSHLVADSVEGLYTFPHPFGCSQMGADHAQTRKLLAALAQHPNAGGVLVVGLGCENLTMEQFKEALGDWDESRVKFMICQNETDELETGAALLAELAAYAAQFRREALPVSKLVVGMKCGGSDGLSGITANPLVGAFSDKWIARGGTTVLSEVPEMFGAEALLMNRCVSQGVFEKAVEMIDGFKAYFASHNQVVYENPSPGNKAGGITTLEDKSLGCVQKGGTAPVVDVLAYGERIDVPGLNLLSGPGNDLVSATALTAAGAHMILFTTGRGTPFGAPAPTLKISTNTALAQQKKNWIDFNAGVLADGADKQTTADALLKSVIAVASGTQTQTEKYGYREISIFKDGVVL